MRKAIYIFTMLSLTLVTVGSAGAVDTSLNRGSGGGDDPIVKVKWEMEGPYASLLGTDDSSTSGAQFDAPGVWDATMDYSICAIVTDPNGVADIDGVYTDIYFPSDHAFHPMDPNHPDQINGGDGSPDDYGINGCGAQRGDENRLTQLSKTDGYDLFCGTIRGSNNNLPSFYDIPAGGTYDYNEICDPDGELMKETAYVYCADKELIWEDPAGPYLVKVFALDKAGNFSNIAENTFKYLPLTSFDVDFTSIDYGTVNLNTHKVIPGDLTWGNSIPSVRNTGNTRLQMGVLQDDMGLGTTDGQWNVQYDARVGNEEADWRVYDPEEHMWLEDILDLSEVEEMDFSIEIFKFPFPDAEYSGTLTLDSRLRHFRKCRDLMRTMNLENKTDQWVIISNDQIEGDIDYHHNATSFHGLVTGQGLDANSKYQVSLNGPGTCTATDDQLAAGPGNLFSSGYWNGGTNLEASCTSPGEGIHNMDLISDWYTIITDANGDFSHPFNIALPPGDYSGVKVIVKKMLGTHVSPWVDTSSPWPANGLFEVAPISFTVLP